jgi:hypothetical protein
VDLEQELSSYIGEGAQSRRGRSCGQPDATCTFAGGVVTTEHRGSQGDQFVKSRRSRGQIIMAGGAGITALSVRGAWSLEQGWRHNHPNSVGVGCTISKCLRWQGRQWSPWLRR